MSNAQTKAAQYLQQVKQRFAHDPRKFQQFLNLLNAFKTKLIDTRSTVLRARTLFSGHPDLLFQFNQFLPAGTSVDQPCSNSPVVPGNKIIPKTLGIQQSFPIKKLDSTSNLTPNKMNSTFSNQASTDWVCNLCKMLNLGSRNNCANCTATKGTPQPNTPSSNVNMLLSNSISNSEEWVPITDKSSGDTYFWNRKTNETTWDNPFMPQNNEATQPIQTIQPLQPIQNIQPVQPIQTIQPVQPFQTIQPVQPIQPTFQPPPNNPPQQQGGQLFHDAATFVSHVKVRLGPQGFSQFIGLLTKYQNKSISKENLRDNMFSFLSYYPDLQEGFRLFVMPGDDTQPAQQQVPDDEPPPPPPDSPPPDHGNNPAFSDALQFVQFVSNNCSPAIYQEFLSILKQLSLPNDGSVDPSYHSSQQQAAYNRLMSIFSDRPDIQNGIVLFFSPSNQTEEAPPEPNPPSQPSAIVPQDEGLAVTPLTDLQSTDNTLDPELIAQCSNFKSIPISKWTPAHSAAWVLSQPFGNDAIATSIYTNEIKGEVLTELEVSDLNLLGVTKMGPQKEFLKAISILKNPPPKPQPTVKPQPQLAIPPKSPLATPPSNPLKFSSMKGLPVLPPKQEFNFRDSQPRSNPIIPPKSTPNGVILAPGPPVRQPSNVPYNMRNNVPSYAKQAPPPIQVPSDNDSGQLPNITLDILKTKDMSELSLEEIDALLAQEDAQLDVNNLVAEQ